MTSTILITGGTGALGSHVVPLLQETGHDLRVLSRRRRELASGVEYVTGDLLANEGLQAAVAGVETVVHLAGAPKGDDQVAKNLVRAASQAGVQHVVLISVIGADKVPVGWVRAQHAAEKRVAASGIPFTTLRAAQFHDLVLTMLEKMSKLPVVPTPGGLRFQPVDSREVAARLAELALGQPAGQVTDLAGPKVYGMAELVRGYLHARGKHRLLMPMRIPGKAGRSYRAGDNLNLTSAVRGTRTWEAFLAERVTARHGRDRSAQASAPA
jgi:uncharacterized protein YbjT (DUF2867 family)